MKPSHLLFLRGSALRGCLVALFFFFFLILAPCSCVVVGNPDDPDPCPDCLPDDPEPLGDVTDLLDSLGNPHKARYPDGTVWGHARNVWDMHAFDGKIYIGGGDSSPNAGPVDIWAFDPAAGGNGEFVKEHSIPEEELRVFKEIDGELYIPGDDAQQNWDWGSFYRLEAEGWKQYRTIPGGIHVYDILKYGGRLLASGSFSGNENTLTTPHTCIQASDDNGLTWHNAFDIPEGLSEADKVSYSGATGAMLPVGDALYTSNGLFVCEGSGSEFVFTPGSREMFRSDVDPNVPDRLHGYVAGGPIRVILFDGATLYVFNTTIYGMPRDIILVRVRSAEDKYALNLPPGAEPRDMIVRGERLLLLTATPLENGEGFVNAVFATKDVDSLPVVWTELLRFTSPILARSFEHLDGKFYFGLGFDWNPNVIPPGSTFDEPFAGVILSVAFEGL